MIGSNVCERRRGTVDQTSRTSEASVWNEDVSISRQIEPHVPAPLIFITASGPYLHESPHHRPTKRQLGIPESNVSRPRIYIYIYTCTLLFAAPFEMDNRVEIGKVRDETRSSRQPLAERKEEKQSKGKKERVSRVGEPIKRADIRRGGRGRRDSKGDTTHGSSQSVAASC